MRATKAKVTIGLAMILVACIASMYPLLWGFLPGGSGVIARAETSDGIRFYVLQEYNYSTEPYTVGLYYSLPASNWRWFYLAHEDLRWQDCEIRIDEKTHMAAIYRDGNFEGTLDWTSDSFTRTYSDELYTRGGREMPPEWKSDWDQAPAN